MPMALRDKLNSLAAEAASKANTAIENGKLSLKINNEEKKIDEFTLNIGELVLDKLDGGETFDDEIMALYSSIQAAREVPGGQLLRTLRRQSRESPRCCLSRLRCGALC